MSNHNFILDLLFVAALGAAAGSCVAGDIVELDGGGAQMPVAFELYQSSVAGEGVNDGAGDVAGAGAKAGANAGTRAPLFAAVFDTDSLKKYGAGIFAFYQKANGSGYADNYDKLTGEPTFMYNQHLIWDGSAWDYSPKKYWPNNDNDQISFFAYAPYDSTYAWEDLRTYTDTRGEVFCKKYIIEEDIDEQQDFLFCAPLVNVKRPTSSTTLNFSLFHVCSRIGVTAVANIDDNNLYTTVDRVDISGVFNMQCELEYTLSGGTYRYINCKKSASALTFTPVKGASHRVTTTETRVNGSDSFLFLLPGTQDVTVTVTISQHNTLTGYTFSGTITKTFQSLAFATGKAYDFKINFTLDRIDIAKVTVDSYPIANQTAVQW